jgi:ABC-2 type transport system ATP-binding protein
MISCAHVRKTFGPVVALDDVSLRIEPGERVALVGANGSGKTTLLRAILGLVRVDGHVTIGGRDVAREPEVALRGVAYVPQIAPPLEVPVSEVVRAHARIRGIAARDTAARARKLNLDLDAIADKRFRDLSGGMKQKLLAAMALATNAPVLVCDEPTANLDSEARTAFFEELEARPAGGIVLLCSHRSDEVRTLVDRVVEMRDGHVSRDGGLAPSEGHPRSHRLRIVGAT